MLRSLLLIVVCCWSLTIQAEEPAKVAEPAKLVQADDGSVMLHSKDVTIHGKTVRYEPQPHKNTIGFWTKVEDWVSWDFEVKQAGKFQIVILQGCGNGSGGAEVEFAVGEQKHKMTVKETGGFQKFIEREIGVLELKPGKHTLSVKPLTKPGVAVMDLRQVVLQPVK
jgi:arylsulfatase A